MTKLMLKQEDAHRAVAGVLASLFQSVSGGPRTKARRRRKIFLPPYIVKPPFWDTWEIVLPTPLLVDATVSAPSSSLPPLNPERLAATSQLSLW